MNSRSPSVLIVAGEASSALYAQRLLEAWQKSVKNVRAFGIGNREMENLGFECLGRSEEMGVVGLLEVIRHFPLIRKVFNSLLAAAEQRQPDFALLLDYPDFNLRLAKQLKRRGIRVVYYISPQVWAWRTGRVKLIQKYVDQMLVLFPFEEEFYKKHGVSAKFVGHPLIDEIAGSLMDENTRQALRARCGISPGEIVLGLMPGSRRSEINHHMVAQIEAAEQLSKKHQNLRVVLLVAPTLEKEFLKPWLADTRITIQMVKQTPFEMIQMCDLILCASGTATLMVGLMRKPMVIMYRMNALTAWFAKKLVRQTPFFGMVNLIMGKRLVPELFQEQANPASLAYELDRFLTDRDYRTQVVDGLDHLSHRLGAKGATQTVVQSLDSFFTTKSLSIEK